MHPTGEKTTKETNWFWKARDFISVHKARANSINVCTVSPTWPDLKYEVDILTHAYR